MPPGREGARVLLHFQIEDALKKRCVLASASLVIQTRLHTLVL